LEGEVKTFVHRRMAQARTGKDRCMNREKGRLRVGDWFALSVGLLAVSLVILLVLLFAGALFNADDLLTWLLALVGIVAVAGWYQDKLARAEEEKAAMSTREREERERHEQSMKERERTARLERAHRAERHWAGELRSQVARLHREQGALGHTGDIRELVLQTAVQLVDAEKGILLSREDEDGDGDFDTVCHTGFKHDPTGSAVAQAFAGRVLRHDETVREDDSRELRKEGRTAADEELENLLAIPIFIQEDFSGVVLCANRDEGFEELDDDVLLALGDHAGAVLDNGRLQGEMRDTYVSIVRMLAEAIEAKDPSTRLHSEEVAGYVSAVADRLDIGAARREELVVASLLHDVGKIGISERILLKPGPLTPDERDTIEMHPRIGFHLVQQVPALDGIGQAVLHHHERFDGDGYPGGLAGEEIPLEARVVCVADCFSAMTSPRPYRDPFSMDEALGELERCAGTHFDPRVVTLFVDEVRRRPPGARPAVGDGLDSALEDQEIRALRNGNEPVLGYGPVGAVDNLTLLYSFRHMHEATAAAAENAAITRNPFAVVLLELTELAEINARGGFAAGDRVITEAARAMGHAAARARGTACRYGGRRLALLVPDYVLEPASALGRDLEIELQMAAGITHTSAAVWQPGDSGDSVIERARIGLALSEISAPESPAPDAPAAGV